MNTRDVVDRVKMQHLAQLSTKLSTNSRHRSSSLQVKTASRAYAHVPIKKKPKNRTLNFSI